MMQDIDWPKPDGKLRIFQLEQELSAARAAIRDLAGALIELRETADQEFGLRDHEQDYDAQTAALELASAVLSAHAAEIAKAQA